MEHIEEFWASSNQLSSFQEIEIELGGLEGLHTVYFEHNPLQKNAGATYRNKVRLCLRGIKQIDATYRLFLGCADLDMLLLIRSLEDLGVIMLEFMGLYLECMYYLIAIFRGSLTSFITCKMS
jgi:hypothetical protein